MVGGPDVAHSTGTYSGVRRTSIDEHPDGNYKKWVVTKNILPEKILFFTLSARPWLCVRDRVSRWSDVAVRGMDGMG